MQLQHKVVMITGASRGLGRELALAFAKQGASLALCARGKQALSEVEQEIRQLGVPVIAVQADVSHTRDVERFVSVTEEVFGRIDVLINNASVLGPSPMPYLLDFPEADFAEVLRVNMMSPFLMSKRVLPGMLQRKQGVVINVTSEAGQQGYAGWGAYSVSKFALEGLSAIWAEELNGTDVRIHMVDPGELDTAMHALAVPDCDYAVADPAEVVNVFLYLASDASQDRNGERLMAQDFQGGETNGN